MGCIEKYWDYFVNCVIDDFRHLDGRFENFCNSMEKILRTMGPVLLHREVKSVIVPWIQIHIDNAFAEVERLHPVTARTAENNDARISAASKVFSEYFNVFFRRTAKLNFATPLSSKISEELMISLHSVIESLSINFLVSTLGNENNLCTENCEAERKILNHSKEGVIDMLNALTEAFSNVEITEAQEMSDEAPAQQDIQTTTPLTAVQEDDIKQESRRVLFRIGRNRRTNSFGFAKLEEELNKKRRNMHHQRTPCPECPKSGGTEACPKCFPLNFCFLPAHGNSSDGTISKAMCPKCTPDNFCRDTGHGNTEESPAHKSSCVKCSPEYFGCMEDPKAFRNPGNTRA